MRPEAVQRWARLAPLVLVGLVVLTTGHRFRNGFVFDDKFVIDKGEVIHDPSRALEAFSRHTFFVSSQDQVDGVMHVDTYRPITLLTFFLDASLGGRDSWPYHLTNLLLHIFCVWLLYAVALTLLGRDRWPFALFAAAMFAVSPWTAEAQVWINGRSDPCALAFGLGSLWLALRAKQRCFVSFALGASFLAALMCKEVMLGAAPAVALAPILVDGAATQSKRERLLKTTVPVLAACIAYLVIRHRVLGGMRTHEDLDMVLLALRRLPLLLVDGLHAILIPRPAYLRNMSEEYAALPTWTAWAAAIFVAGLALACLSVRRRAPLLSWSAIWYAGTLAPAAIISTMLWPGFGRYLYVPSAGVVLAVGWALSTAWPRLASSVRRIVSSVAVVYLVVASIFLVQYTSSYRDEFRLYSRAIEMNPDAAYGWGFLGLSLMDVGMTRDAIKSLREAVARAPEEQRYRAHLARALADVGDREGAREIALLGAKDFDGTPEAATFHLTLARTLPTRDADRVAFHLVRCLELRPGRTDCEEALEHLLRDAPDAEENRAALERLLQQPGHARYRELIECRAYDRCEPVD